MRSTQKDSGTSPWRRLTRRERRVLIRNGNTAEEWKNLLVTDGFSPETIRNTSFLGVNKIAGQTRSSVECDGLILPAGITNSLIDSCDIGRNAAIHHVNCLSRYQIGAEVMLFNIDEMRSTEEAVFGCGETNGTTGGGWISAANENGGRRILPFAGMNIADAYLWTRHRDRRLLQENLQKMTEDIAALRKGRRGIVGDHAVVKSCRMIADTDIGEHAAVQGANRLRNLTIKSCKASQTTIRDGVELEDGIIDIGCTVTRGVKAVRFYLGTNTTVENGARFIDSVLGDNSTVKCCEVISSITFPFHELHHNTSFLIAATLQGLSDIGAGATIGSNHNSRAADGEFLACRGFWPGLSVSVKHPSKFASFCLLAKGSYPAELNIPIPFTLVSNDERENKLQLYPGYWFIHNMYGVGRNSWKLNTRDPKLNPVLQFEHDYLAPDTVEELLEGLEILEKWAGLDGKRKQIEDGSVTKRLPISPEGVEASERGVVVINIAGGHRAYREMIHYYGIRVLLSYMEATGIDTFQDLLQALPDAKRTAWVNLGGQLLPEASYRKLISGIEERSIGSWDSLHAAYREISDSYPMAKARHALGTLFSLHGIRRLSESIWKEWVGQGIFLQEQILTRTIESRSKDYRSGYRKMIYDSEDEMNEVLGNVDENPFIKALEEETRQFVRLATTFAGTLGK